MSLPRTLLWSVVAGMAVVLVPIGISYVPKPNRPARMPPQQAPATASRALGPGVAVRDQVQLDGVARLRAEGFHTLIDLRPDGEAADQPSSGAVAEAARRSGLAFSYVPTPHGDIPDATVAALAQTLATAERPVMLYCRSGKRAARVWALAEASRTGGFDAGAIAAAVRAAGQPIDDLLPRIEARIAARQGT